MIWLAGLVMVLFWGFLLLVRLHIFPLRYVPWFLSELFPAEPPPREGERFSFFSSGRAACPSDEAFQRAIDLAVVLIDHHAREKAVAAITEVAALVEATRRANSDLAIERISRLSALESYARDLLGPEAAVSPTKWFSGRPDSSEFLEADMIINQNDDEDDDDDQVKERDTANAALQGSFNIDKVLPRSTKKKRQ
jgi:hypothetical protein